MSLRAESLSYRLHGRALLQSVSLTVTPGRVHALLGPNGAGKSTALRLLAREWRGGEGAITLNGQPLAEWAAPALARQRAVLPQSESLRFSFPVHQVVALGRLCALPQSAAREAAIVEAALALTDVLHLRDRPYPELSGGERQRVQLARVLAQIWEPVDAQPRYLLLDEPTASLDLKHQHDGLRIVREFAARGVGVLAVLHDPNLALAYADDVTWMRNGQCVGSGLAREMLTPEWLQRIYGLPAQRVEADGRAYLLISAA